MTETNLRFPVIADSLPPPPPGSLDEYYEFICLLASMRSTDNFAEDADEHDGPPFHLDVQEELILNHL